jgi:uncharacterized membrane protein
MRKATTSVRRPSSRGRWYDRIGRLAHSQLADRVFWISILLKAIDGALETIGGLILLGTSRPEIVHLVRAFFREELIEDPADWLAHFVIREALHLSPGMKLFAVVYLVSHGVIKLVLAGTLWQRRLWAYPLAGVFLSLFIIYQTYRFVHTYSILMLLLTLLDLVIIALLPSEYQRASARLTGRDERR